MFDVKTRYETYKNCWLETGEYANNNHVAVRIMSEEGPIADITVNVADITMFPEYYSCVDVCNFPEAEEVIQELGIAKTLDIHLRSGWNLYPVYIFDKEKIKEYTE